MRRNRNYFFTSIAQDYETHSQEAMAAAEEYLANPVNVYLLMKRLTSDWQKVTDMLNADSAVQGLSY